MRRRDANRSAGVAAPSDSRETGRDRSTGSPAGAAGVPRRVVRVTGLTAHRTDGRDTGRQLVHVGFSEDHGSGLPQLTYLEGVVRGDHPGQRDGSTGSRQVRRIVIVLQDDRDTVERSPDPAECALLVQCRRLRPGVRVQVDHAVQRRTSPVVRAYPGEVCVHELHCSDPPGCHWPEVQRSFGHSRTTLRLPSSPISTRSLLPPGPRDE